MSSYGKHVPYEDFADHMIITRGSTLGGRPHMSNARLLPYERRFGDV